MECGEAVGVGGIGIDAGVDEPPDLLRVAIGDRAEEHVLLIEAHLLVLLLVLVLLLNGRLVIRILCSSVLHVPPLTLSISCVIRILWERARGGVGCGCRSECGCVSACRHGPRPEWLCSRPRYAVVGGRLSRGRTHVHCAAVGKGRLVQSRRCLRHDVVLYESKSSY